MSGTPQTRAKALEQAGGSRDEIAAALAGEGLTDDDIRAALGERPPLLLAVALPATLGVATAVTAGLFYASSSLFFVAPLFGSIAGALFYRRARQGSLPMVLIAAVLLALVGYAAVAFIFLVALRGTMTG